MMKVLRISCYIIFPFIVLLSCGDSDGPDEEEEVKKITLEGDYRDTWTSETDENISYSDFGISAKLRFSDSKKTKMIGEFFATSSFTSCCDSGENDGTLNIDLNSDQITSFRFSDRITDCTGNFTGTGAITSKNPYTLEIDFTGNDCDGNHVGVMILKRIEN